MELIKIIVTIALTYTFMVASATRTINVVVEGNPPSVSSTALLHGNFKRVGRFLQQEARNPRAADHCHKDADVCYIQDGVASTCCNNKCIFLATDNQNCGACKRKCKFTQVCCRGECVDISFDKRHCGDCNHRCNPGEYCVYGMCNYA